MKKTYQKPLSASILYAAFHIGSYITHGVCDGTRHGCGSREETFFHDEAFSQFIEYICNLLDFCGRCIYRSDEGHRLLVGDGDVWHHEEEGGGRTFLVEPFFDVGRWYTCCNDYEFLTLVVENFLDTL